MNGALTLTELIIRRQLEGPYSQHDARTFSTIVRMVCEVIGDSPIGLFEDHHLLPALAALLGHCMNNAKNAQRAAQELVDAGSSTQLLSLYPGDDAILNIIALTNRTYQQMPTDVSGTVN